MITDPDIAASRARGLFNMLGGKALMGPVYEKAIHDLAPAARKGFDDTLLELATHTKGILRPNLPKQPTPWKERGH